MTASRAQPDIMARLLDEAAAAANSGEVPVAAAVTNAEGAILFHAGTKIGHDGQVTAHGGRVLAVTGLGDNPASARATAYEAVDCIDWPEGFFRTDIAAG